MGEVGELAVHVLNETESPGAALRAVGELAAGVVELRDTDTVPGDWSDLSTDNRWAPGGEMNCGPGKPGNLVCGTPKENAERADAAGHAPTLVTARSRLRPRDSPQPSR